MKRTIVAYSSTGLAVCFLSSWIFDKTQPSLCAAATTNNNNYEWNTNWDNKHDLYNPKKKVGTHYIVLVRHGQYEERQELDKDRKLTSQYYYLNYSNNNYILLFYSE